MAKIAVDATHLIGTDVSRVSLVKHNATRIPFRIVKEDTEQMLDLSKIGRSLFQKAEGPAAVVAVMVNKSADMTKYGPILEKAGLVLTQKSETEDAIVYTQPKVEAGKNSAVLKLDSNVALIVSGLGNNPVRTMKDFDTWDIDSTAFTEVMHSTGFFPAVYMVMEAMCKCVRNIMDDADDAAEASPMISAAFDDAKAYLTGMLAGIPVQAFKADAGVNTVLLQGGNNIPPPLNTAEPWIGTGGGIGVGSNANGTAYDAEKDKELATGVQLIAPASGVEGVSAGMRAELTKAADGTLIFKDEKGKTGKVIAGPNGTAVVKYDEPSMVNADQNASRPTDVSGGKQPSPTNKTPEAAIGDMTTKEVGIEDTQEPSRPSGAGGKLPAVVGQSPEAPIGDMAKPEPSMVNMDQGRPDTTVAGMMKALQDSIEQFKTTVMATMTDVKKSVTEIDARVKKAEEAVNGTVLGEPVDDLPNRPRRTVKSDGHNPPPLLDTAYGRRAG